MIITRSSELIADDKAFKKVVLPDDVPPLIKILYFAATSLVKKSEHSRGIVSLFTRSSSVISSFANFRIVKIGPFRATFFNTPFTLYPFSSRASTIGFASLISR